MPLLLVTNLSILAAAQPRPSEPIKEATPLRSSFAFRSAAFFPLSDRFREIYGDAGVDYQLEASTKIYGCCDAWVNFDWFSKHGKSVGLHDSTRISIGNTSLGVKFPYRISKTWTIYVGIGPSFGRIWLKNKSYCPPHHISKWAYGGVLKTGVDFFFTEHLFLDVFADYLYQPTNFKTHVDVGGVKVGAGLGVKF